MIDDKIIGLSNKEVEKQCKLGNVNTYKNTTSKSYKDIITSNLFTLFNFINVILAGLVILTGQLKNLLFITIVFWNIIIGIVQEIRSKRVLDKLSILNADTYDVVRDLQLEYVHNDNIVLGDVILIHAGQQIPCDCRVISGDIEVNESLITGESDIIKKHQDNELCSGSIVVSGQAYVKVLAVGKEAYVNKILKDVKVAKKQKSELMDSLNKILKIIGIIIIPIGALLFAKQYFLSGVDWRSAVTSTVAALIGMIPEGIILLTSITLALGTIRLAKQQTLVRELYCIETLARVDTLCCDKTGTITEGNMQVVSVVGQQATEIEIAKVLHFMFEHLTDNNATAQALRKYVSNVEANNLGEVDNILPFSSSRKCSAIHVKELGTFYIGAYNFVLKNPDQSLIDAITLQTKQGRRVIVLCFSKDDISDNIIDQHKTILGFVALTDPVRSEAKQTLEYFYKQGVDVKVISGDDVNTVAQIAKEANVKGADKFIDASTLKTDEDIYRAVAEYSVFGRVTPEQKQVMVKALQQQGHTTAMTGDGVNDVLALKAADCSIAMGNGSDATKNVANLVLLDSNFAHMPTIVNEGRRVINNIRCSTSLFLVKTVFSVLLSIMAIFALRQYPFQPIQLSIISGLAIGMPAYLLALENNPLPIVKDFTKSAMKQAIPGGVSAVLLIVIFDIIKSIININFDHLTISTICMWILAGCIFNVLYQVSKPLDLARSWIIIVFGSMFVLLMTFGPILFTNQATIAKLDLSGWIFVACLLASIIPLQAILRKLIYR